MIERWAEIAGFEGLYAICSDGEVWALNKMQRYLLRNGVEAFRFIPAHQIAWQLNNNGYRIVHLYKGNRRHVKTVHRLVALAFLPQTDVEVDHEDHDRNNPRLDNLKWVSPSVNKKRQRRWQK